MQTEQIIWILAWFFFLFCLSVMMVWMRLIFGRRDSRADREKSSNNYSEFRKRQKAIETLEKQYAKGKISQEAYEQKKKELYNESVEK